MSDAAEPERARRYAAVEWCTKAVAALAIALATGCGGGGGAGADGPPAVVPPPEVPQPAGPVLPDLPGGGTALVLAGSSNDPVTKGRTFSYTQASARLDVSAAGGLIRLDVYGDERWTAQFAPGTPVAQLAPGIYRDLRELSGAQPASFNFDPAQPATGCALRSSDVTVESVRFAAGVLAELTASFEQRCTGTTALMRGRLRWVASDNTQAPGPLAAPAALWQPPPGAVPASGNYVYLDSSSGDPIGGGGVQLHTQADTWIDAEPAGPRIKFILRGDRYWFGTFWAMDSLARLEPGYYTGLLGTAARNPRRGAVEWVAPIERCGDNMRGWLAIDSVQYRGDALTSIELRFEQRCADGTAPPLRGKIRWALNDPTHPPGPAAIPVGLWQPRVGAVPEDGSSYVYLEGQTGEYVTQGQTVLVTPGQFPLVLYESGAKLSVSVGVGPQEWSGTFRGGYTLGRLERGYYGDLQSHPWGNPARGALNWSGQGRGCEVTGWFAVDDIQYTLGELRSVVLRFEQRCSATSPVMRGKIRWTTSDPVVLAQGIVDGPLPEPEPPTAVEPPTSGSYVLLDSGVDDFIGAGGRYLYTRTNARLGVVLTPNHLQVSVNGSESWFAQFSALGGVGTPAVAPSGTGSFTVPGDTAGEQAAPQMNWSGDGRGCGRTRGSFQIERLTVNANGVQELDMTFEQYCEDAFLPLRGRIHWVADDPAQPQGPVWPIPDGLWRLPEAFVPAGGNYLYVHGPTGEFVGGGVNRLFKEPEAAFTFFPNQGEPLHLRIYPENGGLWWLLNFGPPYNASRLAPGLYPSVTRAVVGNPAFGRMDISGESRSCNMLDGWFAVDAITYEGNDITALDLRFEQYCEFEGPPLRGQLRWRR